MTVVSTKEFNANQEKYFDLALNERVFIKKGNYTFFVTNAEEDDDVADLALAKSQRNDSDKEFVSIDEFLTYMKNNLTK